MSHPWFDNFILGVIIITTILLAFDSPLLDPNGRKVEVLTKIDYFFTAIFLIEAVLKILYMGFAFNGSNSYIRNGWNIIDFLIVVFALISIAFSSINLKFIKALRMLRVLRPLRMISRNPSLKIAV